MKKQQGFTLFEFIGAILLLCLLVLWCINLYILVTTKYNTWDAIEPWARTFFAVLPILLILRN